MRKNKASTGVLMLLKKRGNKNPKHKGNNHYYMLFKKAGMPEHKYKTHSSEIALEKVQTRTPSRKAWDGQEKKRDNDVKQYQKSENKW